MRTIGIDLSSQPKKTAAAVLTWDATSGPEVVELVHPATDDELVALVAAHSPARVGIDSPFGWPTAFVEAVAGWDARGTWPADAELIELRMRLTDRFVHERTGRWPLAVAADRIAVVAFRCARLLQRLSGDRLIERVRGTAVEVYPAAARRIWCLPAGAAALPVVEAAVPMRMSDAVAKLCTDVDHCLDALLCALVARAVDVDQTVAVPDGEDGGRIAREGWIELPQPGSLESLAVL